MLLVLLGVVPALGMLLFDGLSERARAGEAVRSDATALMQLTAANVQQFVESTRNVLLAMANLAEVRTRDANGCSRVFRELLPSYPQYANLAAADANGDIFGSAIELTQPVNVSARSWFTQALHSGGFAMGSYQVGVVTRRSTVNFALPVRDADGKVQCVVFAALDLAALARLIDAVQLPRGAAVSILDRQGVILARNPDGETWAGRSMADAPLVRTILSTRQGAQEVQGIDGVVRLHAFAPIPLVGNPKEIVAGRLRPATRSVTAATPPEGAMYVSIGIPRAIAFADIDRALARNLVILAVIAMVAMVLAYLAGGALVLRPVRRLLAATRRLAEGDLGARAGLSSKVGELNQFAVAFDQMAESLQQREDSRLKAQGQLRRSEERYRLIFLANPVPMWVYDCDTMEFLEVNEAAIRKYGYTRDEFMSLDMRTIHFPQDVPEMVDMVKGLTGKVRDVGFWRHRAKDGSELNVEVRTCDLVFYGHRARLVMANDIAARHRDDHAPDAG